MTKKKLNYDTITNELEGASLFFTRPATPPPPKEETAASKTDFEPTATLLPETPVQDEPAKKVEISKAENRKDTNQRDAEISKRPDTANTSMQASNNKSNHDTVIPRNHDTTTPRYHDTTQPLVTSEIVSLVRKAVKEFGKEAATHRFTINEKKEIGDLIYVYKNRGIKTSENEITRISVNFIVEDYKENGENSVLHKILEALNG